MCDGSKRRVRLHAEESRDVIYALDVSESGEVVDVELGGCVGARRIIEERRRAGRASGIGLRYQSTYSNGFPPPPRVVRHPVEEGRAGLTPPGPHQRNRNEHVTHQGMSYGRSTGAGGWHVVQDSC